MVKNLQRLLPSKRHVIFGASLLLVTFVWLAVSTTTTSAAELPSCATENSLYNDAVAAPIGAYDVYVRLGKAGQLANVQVTSGINGNPQSCELVGSADASGDRWTLLGKWTESDVSGNSVLALTSDDIARATEASKPVLLLIPQSNPVCLPAQECEVQIQGQMGYVRPGSTPPGGSLLQVLVTRNPADDIISQVAYYVDNQLAYTRPTFSPFDLRYISSNKQSLLRVVSYQSGQRIFVPTAVPENFTDSFAAYVFRFARLNRTALIVIAAIGATMALFGLALLIIRLIYRRQRYRFDHGLAKEKKLSAAEQQIEVRRSEMIKRLERMVSISALLLAVVAGAWMFNSFVVQAATVDGRSMEKSYQDGNHVFVNKIGKTWSRIAAREYVPQRGDVVVAKAVFGITNLSAEQPNASYIVKRVIGLPGERVVVEQGAITIYNDEHPEGFSPSKGTSWQKNVIEGDQGEYIDVTLGPSELFISGDNRPGSIDSRYNGPINTRNIIGTVFGKF